MKTKSHHSFRFGLLAAFSLLLICLAISFQAYPAQADAGGFPTPTRTSTPVPTHAASIPVNPQPTSYPAPFGGLPFAPTFTFTPSAPGANIAKPQGIIPDANASSGLGQGLTSTTGNATTAQLQQPPKGLSLLSCWPIIVVAVLIAAVVFWILNRRSKTPAKP